MLAYVFFAFCFAVEEPSFNGLRLSEWATILKDDPLPRKRRAAVVALGQLVTEKTRDAALGPVARAMVNDSQAGVRLQAALVLGAQPAEVLAAYLPELTEGLRQEKDAEVKRVLANNLGRLGKAAQAAVLPLIDALQDAAVVQAAAADALGKIGPGAQPAATPLLNLLNHTDPAVKQAAVFALGRIDPVEPETVANALAELLFACYQREAIAELNSALTGGLGSAKRAVPLVAEAVGSLALIASNGSKTRESVQAIAGALRHPDAEIRRLSAQALSRMTVAAKAAEDLLRLALSQDEDKLVRLYAVRAFAASATEPEPMIMFFAERLKSEPEYEVRMSMVEELGALGTNGKAALPVLREAQRDAQVKVREAATKAIRRIQTIQQAPEPAKPR